MTYLDVLALSEEVERDSQSGKLSSELLAQGQTRYGNMADSAFFKVVDTFFSFKQPVFLPA
ncbi:MULTISPECIES: hypothetical protein [Pseudidiomarina]|uniref:hypothetical protein n=1 Tax=Pseudidiomarina TaxID=2800384 RepID=UPI000D71AA0A|nr:MULTISPECIES: hypothetical protein [Pseudidiomarina]